MKFGKALQSQQLPTWADSYIDYKGLKKVIKALAKGRLEDAALWAGSYERPPGVNESGKLAPLLSEDNSRSVLETHKAAFFFKLEREVEKVNAFYLRQENTLRVRIRTLLEKRRMLDEQFKGKPTPILKETASYRALYEGFKIFERDLARVQQFIELNATACRKILKKWDKRSRSSTKDIYLARQVEVQPVFNREIVASLSDIVSTNLLQLNLVLEGRTNVEPFDYKEESADTVELETSLETSVESEGDLVRSVLAKDETSIALVLSSLLGERAVQKQEVPFFIHRSWIGGLEAMEDAPLTRHEQTTITRILWRAALLCDTGDVSAPSILPIYLLDFNFEDDINSRTALHESARAGHIALARVCIERNVPLARPDTYGRNALHYAAMGGQARLCEALLERRASAELDLNAADDNGYSPLVYAAIHGNELVVNVLLQHYTPADMQKATKNNADHDDLSPLSLAAQQGHANIVAILIRFGFPIVPTTAGFYPQHMAAHKGHTDVLRLLIDASQAAGIPWDIADADAQWTPLFHAASEGHVQCVELLLDKHANVSAVDEYELTASHHAAWHGHMDCLALLAAHAPSHSAKGNVNIPGRHPLQLQPPGDDPDDPNSDVPLLETQPSLSESQPDVIPSLFLPPPIIPFKIYGHTFLDRKSLVHITLGHPTSDGSPPVKLFLNDNAPSEVQPPSLRLVMSCRPDPMVIPHSVLLPLQDDREVFSFQVSSFAEFALELLVYPTFGSKLIGKAVALPSLFSNIKDLGIYELPLLDAKLDIVGSVLFELSVVNPFVSAQLHLGGHLETYWKSTTQLRPHKVTGNAQGASQIAPSSVASLTLEPTLHPSSQSAAASAPSIVTASSLSGDHISLSVQLTSDRVPVVYPHWHLPVPAAPICVPLISFQQFTDIAALANRSFSSQGLTESSPASEWHARICHAMLPLKEVFAILPASLGVNIDVKYPTRSEVAHAHYDGFHEINAYVDSILDVVYEAAYQSHARHRIVFSSFNPNICTALNWKQPNYAVFFASYVVYKASSSTNSPRLHPSLQADPRLTSLKEAVSFAKTNNLLGLILDATLLLEVPSLIHNVKANGLLCVTFGASSKDTLAYGADAHLHAGVLSYPSKDFISKTQMYV